MAEQTGTDFDRIRDREEQRDYDRRVLSEADKIYAPDPREDECADLLVSLWDAIERGDLAEVSGRMNL